MKCLAIFLFVALSFHTVHCQWMQTSGPTGAFSGEIFYLGNYLFVAAGHGGVYRSADKGLTWEAVNNGLRQPYFCWALDVDGTRLYIATTYGVFYSADYGNSWESISDSGVVGFSIEAIGDEIFVGYHNGLLYYTPDHGNTWQSRYTTPSDVTIRHIRKFGSTLWIGTDHRIILYSPDNGITWVTPSIALFVSGIQVSDGNLYISGNDGTGAFGLHRSTDQGVTWTQILNTGENNISMAGFFKRDNKIFFSGASYWYYSPDSGVSWETRPVPSLFTFYGGSSIAVVDNDLIISYGDGIVFSSDNGTTWVPRNTGYRNHFIDNIAETENAIVSRSFTNGAFVSIDNGVQWKQIHSLALGQPYPIYIYAYGDAIVMSYAYNVYKSTDTGNAWQNILTPDVGGLYNFNAAHVAGFEESLVATSYKGVYFSRNMGDTWKFVPNTTFGPYDLLKSYVQHDTVFVLTQEEIFLSTNFGTEWQKRTAPDLPVDNLSILDMIVDGSMVTMATGVGLYKSPDLGLTWKKMNYFNWEPIYDIETVGSRLILAVQSGIYVSGENGIGWYAVNDGLVGYAPTTILASEPFSYVGTVGQSVWRIPTAELLTLREFIDEDGGGVPLPLVIADCSTLTITNASNDVVIRWYKNGVLIPNESGTTLQSTGVASYSASFENESDIKMSAAVYIGEPNKEGITTYNIVTANGDRKNDNYMLDEKLSGSKLVVVNRWGEIIYSNDSYDNDWFADEVAPGQHFYSIESKCLGKFKGVLSVVK